jgi:hypothetical protein
MATETRIITVCDKCCELLEHNTSSDGASVEIRVEPCPGCSSQSEAKGIIRSLLGCPDLNLDNLEEETIHQIDRALDWIKEN